MADQVPSVAIPAFPHFYNLVVFPSPVRESDESRFFLLKNVANVPKCSSEKLWVEHIPGSIYCLLPSCERNQGSVSVYESRPSFLDDFSDSLEINKKSMVFLNSKSEAADVSNEMPKLETKPINSECGKCFVSHFPSPNKKICKFAREKKKEKSGTIWPSRLRGGANNQHSDSIIERALLNAKAHGINIHAGVRNLANGNCAFEAVIDSINTRECFPETIDGTPDELRSTWMCEVENVAYENWNNGLSTEEWRAGWTVLKESRTYECELGDMVLPGIAHCTKKDLLIFNTSLMAHSPVYVIESSLLCGQNADAEIPICLAYNQTHYEALVPNTDEDIMKTILLKKEIIAGTNSLKMKDVFEMNELTIRKESSNTYSQAVKRTMKHKSKWQESGQNKIIKSSKDDQERLAGLKNLGGKGRSKDEEKEYRKLMERKRQTLKKANEGRRNEETDSSTNMFEALSNLEEETRIKQKTEVTRKEQQRISMANKRKMETSDDRVARLEKDRMDKSSKRKTETLIERASRLDKKKMKTSEKRKAETSSDRATRLEQDKLKTSEKRKAETDAERSLRIEKVKQQAKQKRERPKSLYEARNAQNILNGHQIVSELKNTPETIGAMDTICPFCSALKWKGESSSTCCNGGKVQLDKFPEPPKYLKKLWKDKTPEARLFRENSRSFNNALCLSSLKVKTRTFRDGYNPSVVFEGKVSQRCGPLIAEVGEQPRFAQIYIHDPATQHTIRMNNMYVPKSLSEKQIKSMAGVMEKLQQMLMEVNSYVRDFLHICEIPDEEIAEGKLVISCKSRPDGEHKRRYNVQQSLSEVSILTNCESADLVLRKRGGGLQYVNDIHPSAQPMHFTLLFPYGSKGYDAAEKHKDKDGETGIRRVTPREFFAYHINMRDKNSDFLFRGGRLFQEYLCLAFTTMESQRLKFMRHNQKALRADTYKNIKEVIDNRVPITDKVRSGDQQVKFGKKIILASSYVGSPRWYNAQFQDGMAICREYHKPDFFITMTCNSKWTEITKELRQGEIVDDRPDLVARVFKLKKDQLIKDIRSRKIFGKVPAMLWVIEFQKRGLPHAHILVILSKDDRVLTSTDVDNVISSQLPPDPETFPEGSDEKKQALELESIVLKSMVHGPCGKINPSSPCMEDGKCTKNYPKDYCKKTVLDPDNTFPEYQRLAPEDGGRSKVVNIKGKEYVIDNRWIVPYSPYLSLRFNCHINDELCLSPLAAKYLYKYVYKGEDRAMVKAQIERGEEIVRDEIEEYEDLRSVGSSEAAWHLFNFVIAKKHPAVYAMRCHLEDEQQVVFDEGSEETIMEKARSTELTGFFDYNAKFPKTALKYVDFPKEFVWDNKEKTWKIRKGAYDTIGRVHSMNPLAGDVFYLRMLLHNDHCKGKQSFTDLQTVQGNCQESYQEVCRLLGLLQDDKEWDEVLNHGAATKMSSALRELFVIILLFCMPANPKELFEQHHMEWADDLIAEALRKGTNLSETQIKTLILLDIEHRLQSWDKGLKTFNLPKPTERDVAEASYSESQKMPVIIREELDFDRDELLRLFTVRQAMFTDSQAEVFNTVMSAVNTKCQLILFIDARGGTGKTFVLNSILAAVRCIAMENSGSVALAVGTTGIAGNLLHLGRTFHSRFKAPLSPTEDSVCCIDAKSSLADLIRMAKIIVVDEASMLHRYLIEALDRTLRDVMDSHEVFGGKSLILSGDFRQCLPVVKGASRGATVAASLKRSFLWKHFTVKQLTENMRIISSQDPRLENFDSWTVSIGDGIADTLEGTDMIEIPEEMFMKVKVNTKEDLSAQDKSMKSLAEHVYPDLVGNYKKNGWMDGRAILAPTNKQVDAINNLITDSFPGKPFVLTSSDDVVDADDLQRYNTEYLNTLTPSGLPEHRLFLKPGMPLMLMRNLNPKMGLCNGTRLIFEELHHNYLLECTISGGDFCNRKVLIPRISLKPRDREFPFEWSRRQFPVRVAFSMTINKSQGQTFQNVGVWLFDNCFSHGQLYVAVSRVGAPDRIKLAIRRTEDHPERATANVVFKEVLNDN